MPFDKTFFRFVLGFTLMLSLSFSILFFTGKYVENTEQKASAAYILEAIKEE